jgi:hypothetical protein
MMKSIRLHKNLFPTRPGFTAILLGFLLLFSFGMGTAIYFKLYGVAPEVVLPSVVIWQMAIWMPLVFSLPLIQYLIHKTRVFSKTRQWLSLGILAILLIGFHFGWFYSVSSSISPYLGLPKTKYGVYPFFFIFWIMIDIVLLSGLVIYLKLVLKEAVKSTPVQPPNSLYLKKGNKAYLLKSDEILWIAAEDYYVKLYTAHGQFLERKSLKAFLTLLPGKQFIRIHRSTVVNVDAIAKFRTISSQKAEVSLKDGNTRVVSRTYLKPLKDLLASSHY